MGGSLPTGMGGSGPYRTPGEVEDPRLVPLFCRVFGHSWARAHHWGYCCRRCPAETLAPQLTFSKKGARMAAWVLITAMWVGASSTYQRFRGYEDGYADGAKAPPPTCPELPTCQETTYVLGGGHYAKASCGPEHTHGTIERDFLVCHCKR